MSDIEDLEEDKDGILRYKSDRYSQRWDCQFCGEQSNHIVQVRFPSSRVLSFDDIKDRQFSTYLLTIRACPSCETLHVKKDGFQCKICGNHESPKRWFKDIGEYLQSKQMCHKCNYWDEKIQSRDELRSVRIKGQHYTINANDPRPGWGSGFGGTRFIIRFFDGWFVETRNLWGQGPIPERFADQLPDNADFSSHDEWEAVRNRSTLQ